MVSQSDLLPMTMPTSGAEFVLIMAWGVLRSVDDEPVHQFSGSRDGD
jgi:hypothetical protein